MRGVPFRLRTLPSFLRRLFGGGARESDDLTVEALCEGIDVPSSVLRFSDVPGGPVLFGPGMIEVLGQEVAKLQCKRAFIVSDPGIKAAGHEGRAIESLKAAGVEVVVFDEVRENPTTKDVALAVAQAEEGKVDVIVGLGGGSSMDTAKGCNFILTNGGEMKDYWGVNKAQKPMLPMIAIPTTAGTGSECQSFALIADEETHMKMACGDHKAAAALAILDPELTLTQPKGVTACTGIDAIAHALETAVCRKRNEISSSYSTLGFRLLNAGFEAVLADPTDLVARARMQLGAAYAGTAIENSMLGAAHSTANPLTAKYGTVHGQAVGLMLPHVIRANRRDEEIHLVYEALLPNLEERVIELLEAAGLQVRGRDLGLNAEDFEELSTQAAQQWTAQFNPTQFGEEGMKSLYQAAF